MSVTERIEHSRQEYLNSKPSVSFERAKAFLLACEKFPVNIYEGDIAGEKTTKEATQELIEALWI